MWTRSTCWDGLSQWVTVNVTELYVALGRLESDQCGGAYAKGGVEATHLPSAVCIVCYIRARQLQEAATLLQVDPWPIPRSWALRYVPLHKYKLAASRSTVHSETVDKLYLSPTALGLGMSRALIIHISISFMMEYRPDLEAISRWRIEGLTGYLAAVPLLVCRTPLR